MQRRIIISSFLVLALCASVTTIVHAQAAPLVITQLLYASVPDFISDPSQLVTLQDGQLSGSHQYGGSSYIKLDTDSSSYATGDFNNDGQSDIAATVSWSGGGSGTFSELILYLNTAGTPQYLTYLDLGDRVDIHSITYSDGIFSVDEITQGVNDPMCCPTQHTILKYQLQNNSLVPFEGIDANHTVSAAAVPPYILGGKSLIETIGIIFAGIIAL